MALHGASETEVTAFFCDVLEGLVAQFVDEVVVAPHDAAENSEEKLATDRVTGRHPCKPFAERLGIFRARYHNNPV